MGSKIRQWLEELDLGSYAEAFEANELTPHHLTDLTDDDLKELGMAAMGHRKTLLRAIARLNTVAESAAKPSSKPPTRRRSSAERRQLTVIFVDLVGSTALSSQLDPEEMREVLRAYQNAVAGEISRFQGHVAKFMGDGVLVYFGWPRAREDEAERAVRAALAVREAVAKLRTPDGTPLTVRIGLATGLVVVGDLVGEGAAQEEAVVGDTPNLAARLQGVAEPGQVVIAETTRRLLGRSFDLIDLGSRQIKGFAKPLSVYAVGGEQLVESRFEARSGGPMPMVGRDQELALLQERWCQAKVGEGQAVVLIGEAGIGKSRITRALLDAIADEPHTRIRYQCSSYQQGTALWPVIQQLGYAAGIRIDHPKEAKLDKLEALLAQAGTDEQDTACALIADLLGLDASNRYPTLDLAPRARRARTLDALTRQLLGLADQQPVLAVLEDAHWIDPTTLELMELSLERIANTRALLLLTSRPDNPPALSDRPNVTRLGLNRLGRAGVQAIVARLGGDRLPDATIEAIIARTDGVPLYVEELTKAVLETGETNVPASLHDSLIARLDLIPEAKEIAQIAACIGREFDYELLWEVADKSEYDVESALGRLVDAELIFRCGVPPNSHYSFKHALVRGAAYESLLKTRRQQIHSAILETLRRRGDVGPEILANHAEVAGLVENAVAYWLEAGKRAAERFANQESIAHLQRGLNSLGSLPETAARDRQELTLLLVLGAVLTAARGYGAPEIEIAYARAELLCAQIHETTNLPEILQALRVHYMSRAALETASHYGERILAIAAERDDDACSMEGHLGVAIPLCWMGQFVTAATHLERAIALSKAQSPGSLVGRPLGDPAVVALAYSGLVAWIRGYPETSLHKYDQALERADALDHPYSRGQSLGIMFLGYAFGQELHGAAARLETLTKIAIERGFPLWRIIALIARGWMTTQNGRSEEACTFLHEALAIAELSGMRGLKTWGFIPLAHALIAGGSFEGARSIIAEAREFIENHKQFLAIVPLDCVEGELLLRQNQPDLVGAETCFQRAITMARYQSAKSFELKATMALARLRASQSKRNEAKCLLAPACAWFTEGFDTSDLQEAKNLLDILS